MDEYHLADDTEAYEAIRAAIEVLGRDDTPHNYGAALVRESGEQVVYFDLPRISPLQFNVSTGRITRREELVAKIKTAIAERLAAE